MRITRLAFLGDLMLGRGISRQLRQQSPEWFWGDVLPTLRQTDAVFANLEAPLTSNSKRSARGWKMFHFRADPRATDILTCANIRFLSLANNHSLDFGEHGLRDTLRALDAAGICHAGAGRNAAEAAAAATLDLPGVKLGILAATDNMRAFAAGPDRAGTNFMAFDAEPAMLERIDRDVRALRRAGVGLIVLSLHWGPNMRVSPSAAFRRFAHAAIERGVDLIHGHSAHVVQAVERHQRGLILYDTGNFIDDYWKFPLRRDHWSFVFVLEIEGTLPRRLQLLPVRTHPLPASLATGDTFRAIAARMKSLCVPFDTPTVDTAEGLEIPLAPRHQRRAMGGREAP